MASSKDKDDPYGGSTDEDEPSTSKPAPINNHRAGHDSDDSGLPDLPDYFTDKHFYLYGDFASTERRLLTRYITAYNG